MGMQKYIIPVLILAILGVVAASLFLFLPGRGSGYETGEEDGGVTRYHTDPNAPKSIASKEITAFSTRFFVYDSPETREGSSYFFGLEKNEKDQLVLTARGGFEGSIIVDETILSGIQEIIDRHELVKLNGIDEVTSGLPYEYQSSWLYADYTSGEHLGFCFDGNPEAAWCADVRDFFRPFFTEEATGLTCFEFHHSSSPHGGIYTYTVEKTEEGVHLYAELNAGNQMVDVVMDEPVFEQLEAIIAEYQLQEWDGFDKVDSRVLDGYTFILSAAFADGSRIYAHGSNAFPERYDEAKSAIDELFEGLIEAYGNLYPKTLESDELNDFMVNFTGQYSQKYFFSAAAQNDGKIRLDIQKRGYEEFYPPEEYYFYGVCKDFPFDRIQAVIRKYDVPAWNGWHENVENRTDEEWFQIHFTYASEEHISAMGSLHPEHYAEARTEILNIVSQFIQENQENFISGNE